MKKRKQSIYEIPTVYGHVEEFYNPYNRMPKMISLVSSLQPKKILDLGCGTGYITSIFAQQFPKAEVIGVDISRTAISLAKKKYSKLKFLVGNAEKKLPFTTGRFDLVISGEHIEHLVDVDSYLEEIFRVTKKGGHLLLTTPNLASWFNRLLLLFGKQPWYLEASYRKNLPIFKIGSFTFPINPYTPAVGHLRLFTLNILKKLLDLYGFEIIEVRGAGIMQKPILKHLDLFFADIPSLSFGLIVLARKKV